LYVFCKAQSGFILLFSSRWLERVITYKLFNVIDQATGILGALKLRKGFGAGQRMIRFFYSTAGGCILLTDPCVAIFCAMERPIIQLFIKSLF